VVIGEFSKSDIMGKRISMFRGYYDYSGHLIDSSDEPVFGFGVAQMGPALTSHIGDSFSKLEALLNKEPGSQGRYLPCVDVPIIRLRTLMRQ